MKLEVVNEPFPLGPTSTPEHICQVKHKKGPKIFSVLWKTRHLSSHLVSYIRTELEQPSHKLEDLGSREVPLDTCTCELFHWHIGSICKRNIRKKASKSWKDCLFTYCWQSLSWGKKPQGSTQMLTVKWVKSKKEVSIILSALWSVMAIFCCQPVSVVASPSCESQGSPLQAL